MLQARLHPDALYLLHYQIRNWGDSINPIFSGYLTDRKIVSVDIDAFNTYPDAYRDLTLTLGIGSIMHHANANTLIWGSGMQSPATLRVAPKQVFAVRGPMTREALQSQGIECPPVYGDPALLLPRYYTPQDTAKPYALGIVSHIHDTRSPLIQKYLADPNVRFISMRGHGMRLVDEICSCQNIISTSLHGLVLADAYQIPACWIKVSDRIPGNDFKFFDYHASLNQRVERPLSLEDAPAVSTILAHCRVRPLDLDLDRLLAQCPYR